MDDRLHGWLQNETWLRIAPSSQVLALQLPCATNKGPPIGALLMPAVTTPSTSPRSSTASKMEDRKRPAVSSADDLAPPSKRVAVNGSKPKDDAPEMKEESWIEVSVARHLSSPPPSRLRGQIGRGKTLRQLATVSLFVFRRFRPRWVGFAMKTTPGLCRLHFAPRSFPFRPVPISPRSRSYMPHCRHGRVGHV